MRPAVTAAERVAAQPEAITSVNIAILDSKDFPPEVAPLQELYSEFIMADGRVLFECPGLIKTTGIDLMNCPLNLILKLRVRRRQPQQGSLILWHVVLPLPVISKWLLNPPHDWETWIGLLPNTQNLDTHGPEAMFTQSVHLISRPEFPKLRLRFTYHNPQLQAQLQVQREQQQQESRRRMELTQQVGRAQFEEIQKLTRSVRDNPAVSPQDPRFEGSDLLVQRDSAPLAVEMRGELLGADDNLFPEGRDEAGGLRDALMSALGFTGDVRHVLAAHLSQAGIGLVPAPMDRAEVLSSPAPGPYVDSHCAQLLQCLQSSLALAKSPAASSGSPAPGDQEAEALVEEGIRMAIMGMFGGELSVPTTSSHLSAATNDQLASLRRRFPHLWERLLEVSSLANERASLLEATAARPAEGQLEQLLQQQRSTMQLSFEAETGTLRRQLEEAKRQVQERDAEVARLEDQLGF